MWVVTGPFDEDHSGNQAPDKSKLLKTDKEYGLGRRGQPLQIQSKAISKAHAAFLVGPCTEEQAADPSFVPTLSFRNLTSRSRPVERPVQARPRVVCEANATLELESGDIVHLSPSIHVRVRWDTVCCYNPPGKGVPQSAIKDCPSLGIHIVPTLHPSVTHHLTPTYALTPPIATSIISLAALVKPEWLITVLNAGRAEAGEPSALEENYVLPTMTKYRPNFSPSLPPRLKKYVVWEPNEERVAMFKNRRFIFVGEKGAEAQNALKELIRRGDGEYECFAAQNGSEGFRQVLAKGAARGATVIPVATGHSIVAAVGMEGWKALVQDARSFELKFVAPEKLVEAAVYADISYIDSASKGEDEGSILPDIVPNTFEDEPSVVPKSGPLPVIPVQEPEPEPKPEAQQPVPQRRLPRRATSRASSRAPSPPPAPASQEPPAMEPAAPIPPPEPAQPRRTLVRRAVRKAAPPADEPSMYGEGDSGARRTSVEPGASDSQEPPRRAESLVPPTPSRPSRLKRRVGTQAQSATAASDIFPDSEDVFASNAEEPPLKKYKALFDDYDPDKMSLDEYGSQRVEDNGEGGGSMTQFEPSIVLEMQASDRPGRGAKSGATHLRPVMEEEEDSTPGLQSQARGTKRKTQDEDVEMEDGDVPPRVKQKTANEGEGSQAPQSRSQAQTQTQAKPMSTIVTRVDMAQLQVHAKPKPPSSRKTQGTEQKKAGEPDKDDVFLRAVASTKRGKKLEDEFDREFNNLRISKPDLEKQEKRESEEEKWKVLEEFGDDGDLRGNFMVVVEMPVFRAEGAQRDHLRRGEGRVEWLGRPDFKKFKKKVVGERRQPVELVVEEENDFGIGSQYWKGGSSQAPPPGRSQSQSQSQPKSSTTMKSTPQNTKDKLPLFESDEEEEPVAKPSKGKGRAKSQTAKPPSTQAKGRGGTQTRGKAGSQRQPLFIESDEDDASGKDDEFRMGSDDEGSHRSDEDEEMGGTLKSTARGTQGSVGAIPKGKKKAPAIVVDDDSDDGATFKAFGAKGSTRSRR